MAERILDHTTSIPVKLVLHGAFRNRARFNDALENGVEVKFAACKPPVKSIGRDEFPGRVHPGLSPFDPTIAGEAFPHPL